MRKKLSKGLLYAGIVLIAITLILGGVQDLHIYNIYDGGANKWYFYSSIGIILLIGIALVAWSYMRRTKGSKTAVTHNQQTPISITHLVNILIRSEPHAIRI